MTERTTKQSSFQLVELPGTEQTVADHRLGTKELVCRDWTSNTNGQLTRLATAEFG